MVLRALATGNFVQRSALRFFCKSFYIHLGQNFWLQVSKYIEALFKEWSTSKSATPVWPDVEIKSCPRVSKSCPQKIVSTAIFTKQCYFSKLPKSHQIFGLLFLQYFSPRTLKITQSGYIDQRFRSLCGSGSVIKNVATIQSILITLLHLTLQVCFIQNLDRFWTFPYDKNSKSETKYKWQKRILTILDSTISIHRRVNRNNKIIPDRRMDLHVFRFATRGQCIKGKQC